MHENTTYFPIGLKLAGRKVVILGGDDEAARKVEAMLHCGAKVAVVSPTATPAIQRLAAESRLHWLRRDYQPGDLHGATLAVACDRALGEAAGAEAAREGVLINVVDVPELCDFVAMATFSRDGLQFAVHSSGKSAALARRIRERLEGEFGEEYAALARLLGELRPVVRELFSSPAERREFWLSVVDAELLDEVERGVTPAWLKAAILRRAADAANDCADLTCAREGEAPAEPWAAEDGSPGGSPSRQTSVCREPRDIQERCDLKGNPR